MFIRAKQIAGAIPILARRLWAFRISDFGFLATFGFRISNLLLLFLLCLCACRQPAPPAPPVDDALRNPAWTGETMGGVYTVKIANSPLNREQLDALKQKIHARLEAVNRQMSHYQPESELSRFNRAPASQPFKVSPDFARVLRLALEIHERAGGAFDPTLGPVINLWGFGEKTGQRQVPSSEKLREAMSQTGCQHLKVTGQDALVKDLPGLQINLSAIAKGFGVDAMAGVLLQAKLTNFFVGISGEIRASGRKAGGENWRVGVSAPISNWLPGDPLVAALSLPDKAISTSGDYQKFFFDAQGRRLCHIFDPRTGHPVQHTLGSVSVMADNCALADALSTTLFVMGEQAGMKFIESLTNAAALFVVRNPDGTFKSVPSSRFPKFDVMEVEGKK
jgi:thiamine biosynthesis lipoprotein